MYLRDPAAVLRRIVSHRRAGGGAVFHEFDGVVPVLTYPSCPLYEQVVAWRQEALAYRGVETMMGMKGNVAAL